MLELIKHNVQNLLSFKKSVAPLFFMHAHYTPTFISCKDNWQTAWWFSVPQWQLFGLFT